MKKNQIEIPALNNLKQQERLKLISEQITAGKSRKEVTQYFVELWNCPRTTVRNLYNEAIVFLFKENPQTRDQLRDLNLARLDELYDECDTVKEKIKTIDTINKTAGIYETNLNVSNGSDAFKFDIGINNEDTDESNKE